MASVTKEVKKKLIDRFAVGDSDTGSVEVQCAIITERIKNLTEHAKVHAKDFSSRNGLMVLVARKKRLLKYLQRQSPERYQKLVRALDSRGTKAKGSVSGEGVGSEPSKNH
ncbi:MAG: 30S ribosomal protein S15 [Rickettsiales bacterium]|jgi:small subunit ribosomal protein S15|nr:30S ribosomal protein S15 [Rickettsiales bacterium]